MGLRPSSVICAQMRLRWPGTVTSRAAARTPATPWRSTGRTGAERSIKVVRAGQSDKFDRESLAFSHASGLVLSVPFLVPALDGFQRAGRGLGGREGA